MKKLLSKLDILPKNILVVRLSSLGDVILTTPFVRILKANFPNANIDFLVSSPFQDVFKYNPYINNLLIYNKQKTLKDISYWKQSIKNLLPENKYDLVFDLQNNFRSIHFTIGLSDKIFRMDKNRLAKLQMVCFKSIPKDCEHIVERYLNTAKDFGLIHDEKGLDLIFDNKSTNIDSNLIAFAPGAKHFTKRWLPEYFITLAEYFINDGFEILLFGSRDEKYVCEYISSTNNKIHDLCGKFNILETAEKIRECKLIVTNDSAAMHIASAVNIPIVAIFGSTVPQFGFTPYKAEFMINQKDISCRPCTHIGRSKCPEKHFNCMKQILPQEVYNSALKLL